MALKDMALGLVITAKDKSAQAIAGAKRGLSSLKNTFSEVRKASGAAGKFSAFKKGLSSLLPSMESVKKTAASVAKGIAGFAAGVTASAATLTVFSKRQAGLADDLTNTANAIGVNREALQVWQIAGERVGVASEKVTDILRNMTRRIGEFAATGRGPAKEAFDALNLSASEFQGLRPEEQMTRLAQALEGLPKGEQVAILEKMSRDASQLQPLLENNAAGLRQIAEDAKREGAIYTEAELDKLVRANDIYNDVNLKIQGLTRRIGAKLAPAVADVTDKLLDMFNQSGAGEKLASVFETLSEKVLEFAQYMTTNADEVQGKLTTLANTFKFLGQSAIAVFRGIQTVAAGFVLGVATGLSNVLQVVERVGAGLNSLGLISDSTYIGMKARADAAKSSTRDLERQVIEYGKQTAEAAGKAFTAFDEVKESTDRVNDSANETVGTLKTVEQTSAELAEAEKRRAEEQARAQEAARDKLNQYGIDLERIMTGVTTEGREAVTAVQELAGEIQQAGLTSTQSAEAFKVGFEEALESISTNKGLEAMRSKLEELKKEGALGSSELAAGLKAINDKQLEINVTKMDESIRDAGDSAEDTADKVDGIKDAADDAGDSAEEAGNKGGGAFDWFGAVITSAREGVYALSTAARNLFEQKTGLGNMAEEATDAKGSLAQVEQELGRVTSSLGRLGAHEGFTKWALKTEQASLQVQKQFWSQAVALENLTDKVQSGAYSMDQLDRIAASADNRFNLMDQNQLQGLQQAIDAAKRKMESLSDSADSTLNNLRQRLADIRGDTEEAQRLQYEAERKRLQEKLREAQEAGASEAVADYREALKTLDQINKVEQKKASEQQQQREKEAADRAREQEMANQQRQQTDRLDDIRNAQDNRGPATQPVKTVKIEIGGREVEVLAGEEDKLIEALENARSRSS